MNRRSLLALALPSFALGATPLTGRWRSVKTTGGGIGAVYDFSPNGSATYSSAAIVEMVYQQEGNQITLGGQPIGIGWHPDGRLQFNYGNNHVEDYTRQGKVVDAANPLLGEWKGNKVMQGQRVPMLLQFRGGNAALLMILFKTQSGHYHASAGSWTLTLPSLPARTITENDGRLTITAAGGDPHQFTRF